MKRRARAWAVALAAVVASCSDDEKPSTAPPDRRADLGGDVIARVTAGNASDAVPKGVVAKVAAEQKVSPADAAHRLVDDAVAAVAARDRGLDGRAPTRWHLVSARARLTVDRLRNEARASGPPSDDEINELSVKYWRQVDRPESARVVHFVVLRSKPANPALDARAKALATEMRGAVLDTKTPEEFSDKAKAYPHAPDLTVVADPPLPPMTDDGYSIEGPGTFDVTFAKAAVAIAKPGETSPVVETPFGWHVIRLIEKIPEQRMAFDARRAAFTEEVYAVRAQKALSALLAPLRAAQPVQIEPSAEQLMRSVMTSAEQ